jgi:hypothetical protein
MGRCKVGWYFVAAVVVLSFVADSARAKAALAAAVPVPDTGSSMFELSLAGPTDWLDVASAPLTTTTSSSSPAPATFRKGTWDLELSGAHMSPIRSTRDYFDAGSAAIGYFCSDNFSLNAALVGYSINQPDNVGVAGGFDLYARLYFLTLARFTFYGDAGAGVFIGDKEVPERGTHFDFTPRTGVGVAFPIFENVYLLGGARFFHLSNAGIHGPNRNPGFDSLQYYGSIMFTF